MVKRILKSYDYPLIIAIIVLAIFGLIMIYSSSIVVATQRYNYASDHFFQRQKLSMILAFVLFVIMAIFPYKVFKSNKFLVPMVLASLAILVVLNLYGHVSGNARSWIRIGPMSIQPSEFIKLSVIVYLSAVYAKKEYYLNQFNKGVVPPLYYMLIVVFIIGLEPDYGTAAIIFIIGMIILFSSGISWKNIGKLILLGGIFAGGIIFLIGDKLLSDNKISRIDGYLDPFGNTDAGWQLVNSYLAIGSGGVKGLGLGQSVQKLGYLPEAHTDFIMAIIAEELGVFGVTFTIGLLAFIVLRGFKIGFKTLDRFGSLLAIGISSMIGIQALINLGGVSGLIPITGVPLPLVSYGGSSIIQLGISLGILVNVSMFNNYERKYRRKVKQA